MKVSPWTLPCIMPITCHPRFSQGTHRSEYRTASMPRFAHLQVAARATVHGHLHQRERGDADAARGAGSISKQGPQVTRPRAARRVTHSVRAAHMHGTVSPRVRTA